MYEFINPSLIRSLITELPSHARKDIHPVSKETGNIMNEVTGQEMRSKPPELKFVLCSPLQKPLDDSNEGSRLPHDRIKTDSFSLLPVLLYRLLEHSTCAETHTTSPI